MSHSPEPSSGAVERIEFFAPTDEHGYLSNFYAAPIALKGQVWPTTEHYFQAQKFAGTPHEDAVRLAKSPSVAAHMGRSRERPLRADWEEVKEQVMLEALRAKFAQHANLRHRLLATGHALLVEHSSRDLYWADGGDGRGRNRLGALLMWIRDEIADQTTGDGARAPSPV